MVLAGIHMTDIPRWSTSQNLFNERDLRTVTANTRADGAAFLRLATTLDLSPTITRYPLGEAAAAVQRSVPATPPAHSYSRSAEPMSLGERSCGIPHPDGSGDADTWVVVFDEYVPAQEGQRESLCTLANGYWGTRGAAEESVADDVHYPGTYFAGVYDEVDMASSMASRCPRRRDGERAELAARAAPVSEVTTGSGSTHSVMRKLLEFHQELDVRHGILTRGTSRCAISQRRVTTLRSDRFVSQATPRLAALRGFPSFPWTGPAR